MKLTTCLAMPALPLLAYALSKLFPPLPLLAYALFKLFTLPPPLPFCCRALPVTARSLETIIRLATASAKMRLSVRITVHDVDVAVGILDHVMRKDVGDKTVEEDDEEEEEEEGLLRGERAGRRDLEEEEGG